MAWEDIDSFLMKDEAEKELCLRLVAEYILELRPRMPMLSQELVSGVLRLSGDTFPGLEPSPFSRIKSFLYPFLKLFEVLLRDEDL